MQRDREGHFTAILMLLALAWLGLPTGFPNECLAAKPGEVAVAILADQTGPYRW
jgi:hypothetical protein